MNSSNLLLTQLYLYRNKDEPFDEEEHPYTEHTNTPINWWTSLELEKVEDHIRKLALKMHAVMPHNAYCEHTFTILGWFFY